MSWFEQFLPVVAQASPFDTILYCGDSITDLARVNLSANSITLLSPGVIQVSRNNHSLCVGQFFGTTGGTRDICTMRAVVAQVLDVNTFNAQIVGLMHDVTGAAPSISIEDRASCRGWVNWLESFAGQPVSRTWAVIAGAATDNIVSLMRNMPNGYESAAYICLGMNDVYSRGYTLDQIKANFNQLFPMVEQRTKQICVLAVPPRNSADPVWSAAKQDIHVQLNYWLYLQCALRGYTFIDTWRAAQGGTDYVNGAAANPDPTVGFVHDFTHPNMRGAYAIGWNAWQATSKWFGAPGWTAGHPLAVGADIGNVLTNSAFTASAGGVATGWQIANTTPGMNVTPTMEARTVAANGDICGNNQVVTFNYGAAAGTASTRFARLNIQALITQGQPYQLSCAYSITGAVGLVGLELMMSGTNADGTFWFVSGMNQDSNTGTMVGDFSGRLNTPVSVNPNALADLDIWVRPYISAAQVTDCVLRVSQPVLRIATNA